MEEIYEKMRVADGIIVAAPVYMGNYPAQLKALFDRSVLLRRKDFALKNKVGAALSVGGSRNGGQEKTIQSIHDWMHIHGMIVVGDNAHFGGVAWNPGRRGRRWNADSHPRLQKSSVMSWNLSRKNKGAEGNLIRN